MHPFQTSFFSLLDEVCLLELSMGCHVTDLPFAVVAPSAKALLLFRGRDVDAVSFDDEPSVPTAKRIFIALTTQAITCASAALKTVGTWTGGLGPTAVYTISQLLASLPAMCEAALADGASLESKSRADACVSAGESRGMSSA